MAGEEGNRRVQLVGEMHGAIGPVSAYGGRERERGREREGERGRGREREGEGGRGREGGREGGRISSANFFLCSLPPPSL